MWRDIFLWNRDNVVTFIEAYERSLGQLKELIRLGDAAGIEKELERARQEREKLSTGPALSGQ
jgi:prephenate dehydrogenase